MDADELRRLLKLPPKETKDTSIVSDANKAKGTSSPWALDLDEFDKAQGSKLIRHSPELRKLDITDKEVSDFYGLHYLSQPEVVESCSDARRLEFVKNILENPAYNGLHFHTEGNPLASKIATEEMAKTYTELKKKDEDTKEFNKKYPYPKKQIDVLNDLMMENAVIAAMKKSREAVDEMEDAMNALGCGPGVTDGDKTNTEKVAKIFAQIKDDKKLKGIFDKAGKCRRFSQAQKRQKAIHGYDDIVGVTLSGKIERLVPQELLQIADVDLELAATQRLLENQSLSKDFQGVERVGKGPVVMCVDGSGSMYGEPNEWARAIALTIAWKARSEKRFCVLIEYSGGTEGKMVVLPPTGWKEGWLLDWLTHFFGGGTDMDVPLEQLPHQWWDELVRQGMPRGKTDLILVTDAICHVPDKMEQEFNEWKKKEQVKCVSIVINGDGGELANVSDEIHSVPTLNLDQEVVQKLLS